MRAATMFALALLCAPARADDLLTHYVTAMQARDAGDHPGYFASMARADSVEPGHPVVEIHLARACALLGRPDEALVWIDRYLERGAWIDLRTDEYLASLADHPGLVSRLAVADALARPRGEWTVGFELLPHDLLPEGITHDPSTGDFYLSSVRERRIVRRRSDGAVEDFVAPARDGFLGGLGLAVDDQRRLWACASSDAAWIDPDQAPPGRAGLWCWTLEGESVGSWLAPEDSAQHNYNDLVVLGDGDVMLTDSAAGTLFRLRSGELRAWLPYGSLRGPNGIAHDAARDRLYVSEYVYGITRIDLATGERVRVTPAAGTTLIGVDGLYFHEGALIGVQNFAGLDRAARFPLDASGDAALGCEVLAAHHPRMDDPTTGVIVDGALWFIANSHIARYRREDGPRDLATWTPVLVLRAQL